MKRNTPRASSRPSDRKERMERSRRDRDFSAPLRSARNDAKNYVSRSEADTERRAAAFAKTLSGGEVLLLNGDLGAGKTVFVRGLAKGLGVRGRITSPTFVFMRVHDAHRRDIRHLVHVDAYRVRNARDLEAIGLLEWVGRPDTIVAIEWGERVRRIAPRAIRVRMTGSGTRRRITVSH